MSARRCIVGFMNTTAAPDWDTIAIDDDSVADWFDTVLDASWTRRFGDGSWSHEDWFTMGSDRRPVVRIVISDGTIIVHEFDDHGCVEVTTRLSGDMTRQAPRVLKILGID